MNENLKDMLSENVNTCSAPSELKITDIRVTNLNGAPKHCPLIKIYTNQGIVGYGEVLKQYLYGRGQEEKLLDKVRGNRKDFLVT